MKFAAILEHIFSVFFRYKQYVFKYSVEIFVATLKFSNINNRNSVSNNVCKIVSENFSIQRIKINSTYNPITPSYTSI